jgi:UDP-N-acetylglucosamine acyltransferase
VSIHPTAIVDKSAEIDATAEIGAYAIIESGVQIGPDTRIHPHAYISNGTRLGRACRIHPFAVVGHHPQDLKWKGTPSYTQIGDETIIREGAQVHRGTMPESTTIVGQRVYIMATGHVGHNCQIGDDVIIANAGMVSGHVQIGNRAFISGCALLHQFVRVGELAMIGGGSRVPTDVPPYMMVGPDGVIGPNVVGLRRAGFTSRERHEIRVAYKTLFRSGLAFPQALAQVAETVKTDPGRRLVEFLQSPSKRGFMRFKGGRGDAGADAGHAE